MKNYAISTVDILKVDIDGVEVELFSTNAREWLPKIKCIMVETHDRFRAGSDAVVTSAISDTHVELPQQGENRVFMRRDLCVS